MRWMLACTLLCLVLPLGSAKRSSKKDGASAASLIRLAEKGDHVALERHLQSGASASTLDREGTLLTHAAAAGHVDTIEVILKYGGTDRATIDRQVGGSSGPSALLGAARNGHVDAVQRLLDRGAALEQRDLEIGTALTHAARHGFADVANVLMDRGANIESRSIMHWTPLHVAADEGHANVVRALLERNANVHHQNAIGETALHRAATGGHVEVMRMLLDAGCDADIDVRDTADGFTPLMRAAQGGHTAAVQLLLGGDKVDVNKLELEETGAQVNIRRFDGNTALSFSTNRNYTDISRLLIQHGADPNSQNDRGESVLMYAAEAGNAEIVQLLLDRGAIVGLRSYPPRAWTPLMWAAQNGHEDVARILMIGGALPGDRTYEYWGAATVVKVAEVWAPGWFFTQLELKGWLGESAAQIALRMGHDSVANLIHQGIPVVEQQVRAVFREHDPSKISDVPGLLAEFEGREWELLQELRNKYGEVIDELPIVPGSDRALISPDSRMREAAGRGDYPSVVAFLKLAHTFTGGVDAIDDTYGQTALMAAAGGGHAKVVALLLDNGADADKLSYAGVSALIGAAHNGDMEVVQLLVDVGGATVDLPNRAGSAPLAIAAGVGANDVLKLLLDRGADVNHQRKDGGTALVDAATWGHEDCMQTLLAAGAEIDIPHREGWTALMIASQEGRTDAVRLLLEAGADVHLTTEQGGVALMHAAQKNQYEIAELLLQHGAEDDINMQDVDGVSALMVAARGGFGDLTRLLLLHGADPALTTSRHGLRWYIRWVSSWFVRSTFNASDMAVVGGHHAVADIIYKHNQALNKGFDLGSPDYMEFMDLMSELSSTSGALKETVTAPITVVEPQSEQQAVEHGATQVPPYDGVVAESEVEVGTGSEECAEGQLDKGVLDHTQQAGQPDIRNLNPPLSSSGHHSLDNGIRATDLLGRQKQPSGHRQKDNDNVEQAAQHQLNAVAGSRAGTSNTLPDHPKRLRQVLRPLKSTTAHNSAESAAKARELPVMVPSPPESTLDLRNELQGLVEALPAQLSWPAFLESLTTGGITPQELKDAWEFYKLQHEDSGSGLVSDQQPEPEPEPVRRQREIDAHRKQMIDSLQPEDAGTRFAADTPLSFASTKAWLGAIKLESHRIEDLTMLIEGDEEEVSEMLNAVEALAMGDKKAVPQVKKFKRELARLRGRGEQFP